MSQFNTEEFERECKDIIEMYGKQWDIKPHVLKGCLWWKDAMEKAFWKGKEFASLGVAD